MSSVSTPVRAAGRVTTGARPDAAFNGIMRALGMILPLLILGIGIQLFFGSRLSLHRFGWHFFVTSVWDSVFDHFGAWPFIYGTLLTTLLALVLAAPLGLGVAIFIAELSPPWLRTPVTYLIDLLAAVPSVVYGLWGILVFAPWLQHGLQPWLGHHFGFLFLFKGPPYGVGFLAAGLILAVMVTPFVVALSREAISTVPNTQREAAYALASTRWEVISKVVLPGARSGILGGVLLAVGRALGETMAVTMVIGNRPAVSSSLFAPGYTLASVIANEFTEAVGKIYTSALIEIGLVLFLITLVVNLLARILMRRLTRITGAVRT